MMRRLANRPGLVFALVFAWKIALLIFTAQPVPETAGASIYGFAPVGAVSNLICSSYFAASSFLPSFCASDSSFW
jgi:hypothetical protein